MEFIQTLGLPHIKVPELSDLINIEPVEPYIYTKTWEQGRNDVFALLHTSGSTGLPKLVPVYLGTAASIDAFHLMQPIEGNMPAGVAWTGIRMLCAMPLFHVSNLHLCGHPLLTYIQGCWYLLGFIFCSLLSLECCLAFYRAHHAARH